VPADARRRLAGMQATLVATLVRQEPPPPGFDPDLVDAAREALLRKRAREAALAWPSLRDDLGEDFGPAFLRHTSRTPPPEWGGPRADGWLFGRRLERASISERTRAELAIAGTEWRLKRGRVFPRRIALAARVLHGPRQLLVVVRAPRFGSRPYYLPLGRKQDRRAA
jgi:hypothetical protein